MFLCAKCDRIRILKKRRRFMDTRVFEPRYNTSFYEFSPSLVSTAPPDVVFIFVTEVANIRWHVSAETYS